MEVKMFGVQTWFAFIGKDIEMDEAKKHQGHNFLNSYLFIFSFLFPDSLNLPNKAPVKNLDNKLFFCFLLDNGDFFIEGFVGHQSCCYKKCSQAHR